MNTDPGSNAALAASPVSAADSGRQGRGARHAVECKRLVIVADNSLIIEAIRVGLRESGEFRLGQADLHRTSARTISAVKPDVVLIDDHECSDLVLELIAELKAEDERIAVMILSVELHEQWLSRLLDAGASAVISKATHPVALSTLLVETLNHHIFHRYAVTPAVDARAAEPPENELTTRECEILCLVAAGSTNGEVARQLWITEQTVKFHLRNIYRKLGVANRTEASHYAHVNGLMARQPTLRVAS